MSSFGYICTPCISCLNSGLFGVGYIKQLRGKQNPQNTSILAVLSCDSCWDRLPFTEKRTCSPLLFEEDYWGYSAVIFTVLIWEGY